MSSNMSADVTKILKKIEADGVKFVRLQFTDVTGMPKNAAIPVAQAEKALTDGTWFDGSSIEGFTRIEESDMLLRADPASYTVLPWRTAEGEIEIFAYNARYDNFIPNMWCIFGSSWHNDIIIDTHKNE